MKFRAPAAWAVLVLVLAGGAAAVARQASAGGWAASGKVEPSTTASSTAGTSGTRASSAAIGAKMSSSLKVMALGSSVAEGWVDPGHGGYLQRTVDALSKDSDAKYTLVNESKAGNGVLQVVYQYPKWLQSVHPRVVIISWGALDDLHLKTPFSTVRQQVTWEINEALAAHAVVFLVTPPITRASYTTASVNEAKYVDTEIAAAEAIHSPNVHVFDVFNQMKAYIQSHHQTYLPYMADGWHPNAAGHALAARLLVADIEQVYGKKPITFVTAKHA
ncbi:MAG: SGNH/GDSL hydrolase family protein [Alicyclobacillus sp.]|nr:SGNH/GDSL hydrolase family protein [Alicyclobacillus sp.]